uniref:Ig-like domain-containing protein n=1 Tax=Lates calcarifer TaxID=8187 RepID=A0A4W6FW91_LATCA
MERQMCFLILSVLLLTVLNSALAQTKPSGVELGAALTLRPTFSGSITGIVWKLNGDLVAEWLNNEFEYYATFRDRTTLDPTTGELVVKNVAVADAGLYTVEINSNVQSQKYQVEVMKKVSKPTVVIRPLTCNKDAESCSLACVGETKDAGTVTYSWREDDGEWKEGKESRDIMNDPVIRKIRTFSCRLKNAISVNESEPHENPFFQEKHLIWPEGFKFRSALSLSHIHEGSERVNTQSNDVVNIKNTQSYSGQQCENTWQQHSLSKLL